MNAFHVVAEPSRRQILDALLDGAQPVNAVVERVGMSQPVVSKHLRILKDAGMVSVEPRGQQRLYSLEAEPLMGMLEWLRPYREYWSARFDALEAHLDELYPDE